MSIFSFLQLARPAGHGGRPVHITEPAHLFQWLIQRMAEKGQPVRISASFYRSCCEFVDQLSAETAIDTPLITTTALARAIRQRQSADDFVVGAAALHFLAPAGDAIQAHDGPVATSLESLIVTAVWSWDEHARYFVPDFDDDIIALVSSKCLKKNFGVTVAVQIPTYEFG